MKIQSQPNIFAQTLNQFARPQINQTQGAQQIGQLNQFSQGPGQTFGFPFQGSPFLPMRMPPFMSFMMRFLGEIFKTPPQLPRIGGAIMPPPPRIGGIAPPRPGGGGTSLPPFAAMYAVKPPTPGGGDFKPPIAMKYGIIPPNKTF